MGDFERTVREFKRTLTGGRQKTAPLDIMGKVTRVEDGVAWVRFAGSEVGDTPVRMNIDCKEGDDVQVRSSGGKAWIVGNQSAPPTDDTTATYVQKQVVELNNSFIENSNIVNAEIVNLKAKDSELDQAIVIQSNIVKSEIYNSQIEDFTVINGVVQGLKATDAEISGKITAAEADIGNLKVNKADVSELEANYAHITNGVIDNAKIGYADVNDLNAHYANIDLANVNNAWIQNGVIKDAAISDAQIIGVGANKITAGVIDASKITVTNLNADNITAGTINGQRIGKGSLSLEKLAEEVPTKEYLDDLAENLQGQIDGQIETWTGTTVPTLNNAPAVDWKGDAKKLKAHVGDIYYVVNAANDADGYTYRFTESGSGLSTTYSWTLIKDNQITKALQEIQEAKGDISGIKQFDSEISSWKTDTDEELSSLKGRTTTLETDMGTKVSTQTFNELSQTVDENTASISSLSETVDTKADSSTVTTLSNTVNTVKQTADTNKSNITNLTKKVDDNETDIEQKYSDLTQDLNGFKTTVGSTYHKISDFNTYKTANDAAVAAAKKAGDDAQADLDDYKDAVEETYATKSALTQTENSIKSEVSSTYATKTSVPTKVSQLTNDKSYATTGQVDTAKSEATAAAISDTDNKLESYSTTTQMNSAIDQKADAITASVAETYSTKSDTDTKISEAKAEIKVTTDGISTEVAKKTDKDTIISTIRQSAESVKIKASQVEIDGATTFNAIKASADAAYDAKGAASDAVGDLVDDLESASGTTVINGGHIETNSIGANKIKVSELTIGQSQVDGLSTALAGKQPTGDYATNTALNNEVNARKASYATSSTDAGTQAKVASCSNFALYTGATITVGFTKANTHATPTLNVNSTGAKTIRNYTGASLTAAEYKWVAGAALTFVYDGTYWRMQDSGATESKAAAAASASTASSKASEAATSASNASSSASTASTKASEAATSASTASTKASEASTSASTASSKATAAANSATTASTKASEASTSASTASSKATAAANSATAAENAKNVALDTVTVKDTRNDNQPPSWYISNYPKKRVQEFKYATKIGLSGDTYCWLQTDVPWGDSSGGYPKQTVEVNGKFYTRQGTAASTWSAWKDLAGIAENYIYAGSDGIKIANADPEHADTYQKQTSNSTEFYVDGVKRSDISGNGMRVYDNDGIESASFGRVPIIGKSEKNHLQLDDDSVDFMDGDTLIGYVGSDSARFPVMHVQSRLSIGDKYELRVTPSGSLGLYLM